MICATRMSYVQGKSKMSLILSIELHPLPYTGLTWSHDSLTNEKYGQVSSIVHTLGNFEKCMNWFGSEKGCGTTALSHPNIPSGSIFTVTFDIFCTPEGKRQVMPCHHQRELEWNPLMAWGSTCHF